MCQARASHGWLPVEVGVTSSAQPLFPFTLENLQVEKPLGVFVQNFFFDFLGQHRVVAQTFRIAGEFAVPVRDIRRKEKMTRADAFDGLRRL